MDRFILILKSDLRYFLPVLKGILAVLGGFGVFVSTAVLWFIVLKCVGIDIQNNPLLPTFCFFFSLGMVGLYVWWITILFRISDIKKKELHDFE